MRIASDGAVGLGTQVVDNNFHVYDGSTGSVTVAKFESAKGASGTTTTGVDYIVRDGSTKYGGFVKGYKTHNGSCGLILGSHDAARMLIPSSFRTESAAWEPRIAKTSYTCTTRTV